MHSLLCEQVIKQAWMLFVQPDISDKEIYKRKKEEEEDEDDDSYLSRRKRKLQERDQPAVPIGEGQITEEERERILEMVENEPEV